MGVEEKEERVNMFVVFKLLIIAILDTLYEVEDKVEDLLDGYRDLKVRRVASRVSLFEAVESTTKEGY